MLTLAGGVVVDPRTGQVVNPAVLPAEQLTSPAAKLHEPPADIIARQAGKDMSNLAIRKMLADFPADPKLLSAIGLVWFYFHLGIPEYEIASALNIREEQIDHIKGLKLFSQLDKNIQDNMNVLATTDITQAISRLAPKALNRMSHIMENTEDESLQAKVAGNLLDRAGFGAKSLVEHRVSLDGHLTIRHIDDETDKKEEVETIDITPNFELVSEDA